MARQLRARGTVQPLECSDALQVLPRQDKMPFGLLHYEFQVCHANTGLTVYADYAEKRVKPPCLVVSS